jgi:hypothetical protein
MEQYSDLHQVPSLQKVPSASLYLENDQFVWYQWLYERKKIYIISWSIFTDELISCYGDIKINIFSSTKGLVIEHIQQFQKLGLRVKNIHEDNLLDLFMGTLKENIQYELHLFESKSLEKSFSMARKVENKDMATRRVATNNYREHHVPSPDPTQPTRLTP